jgi:hypothetical protein
MVPGTYAKNANNGVGSVLTVVEQLFDPIFKILHSLLGNAGPSVRSPVSLMNSATAKWDEDDDNPALHFTPKKRPAMTYRGQMKQK